MRYHLIEHQHKAKAYVDALRLVGYYPHRTNNRCEFLLIDHIWAGLFAGRDVTIRPEVLGAIKKDLPIFVYPHSVRPNIPFDLTDNFEPQVTALFTIAEGHREVLRRIGYPGVIEVTGWPYTEIIPFETKRVELPINVLFAPIHPVGNGCLPADETELNRKTFTHLLGLGDKITLFVRHVQSLESNGLWYENSVRYINGCFDGSTRDMQKADVVIAAFTYAHMAAALGKPLIMMGEGIVPHNTPRRSGNLIYAKNWHAYKNYMEYPFNIEDCRDCVDLEKMLMQAIKGKHAVETWKQRFIGNQFDHKIFAKRILHYVAKHKNAG